MKIDTSIALMGLIIAAAAFFGIDKWISYRVDLIIQRKYEQIDKFKQLLIDSIVLKTKLTDLTNLQLEIKFLSRDKDMVNETLIKQSECSQAADVLVPQLIALFKEGAEVKVISETKRLIEELFRVSVNLLYIQKKYQAINQLQEYGDYYDLGYVIWAYFSVTNMVLYLGNMQSVFKDKAIMASQKATELLPDYGTPVAVRLIINMVDFKTTGDEQYKKQAGELIQNVNSANSVNLPLEILNYLERSRSYEDVWKYIDLLFKTFPDQMIAMKNKSIQSY